MSKENYMYYIDKAIVDKVNPREVFKFPNHNLHYATWRDRRKSKNGLVRTYVNCHLVAENKLTIGALSPDFSKFKEFTWDQLFNSIKEV